MMFSNPDLHFNLGLMIEVTLYVGLGLFFLRFLWIQLQDRRESAKSDELDRLVAEKQVQIRLRSKDELTKTHVISPHGSFQNPENSDAEISSWLYQLKKHNDLHSDLYRKLMKLHGWDTQQIPYKFGQAVFDLFKVQPLKLLHQLDWNESIIIASQDSMIGYHQWDHRLFSVAVLVECLVGHLKQRCQKSSQVTDIDLISLSLGCYLNYPLQFGIDEQSKLYLKPIEFETVISSAGSEILSTKDPEQVLVELMNRAKSFIPLVRSPQFSLQGADDLKQQYHKLARLYHPDRFPMDVFNSAARVVLSVYLNQQYALFSRNYANLKN